MRVEDHPVLGKMPKVKMVTIYLDGEPLAAREGEPVAAALIAAGKRVFRHTAKRSEPRSYYCGLGRCTDCYMTVDGIPQVRTCITEVRDGMRVETQKGFGQWSKEK